MQWLVVFVSLISVFSSKAPTPDISRASSLESLVLLQIVSPLPTESFTLPVDLHVALVSGLLRDLLVDISHTEDIIPLSYEHVSPESLTFIMKWCGYFVYDRQLVYLDLQQVRQVMASLSDSYVKTQDRVFNTRHSLTDGEKTMFTSMTVPQLADIMAAADYMGIPMLVSHISFWIYDLVRGRSSENIKTVFEIE